MGIQGLIPFLEKTSRPINISEFSGCTVAIDAYCWLHKGAFSCAEKLARGEKCDAYVYYCMKYINMLLSHNIKPIMVFDGQHLPAKAATEKKRRENRELNRRRAAELLRQDKPNEARSFIRRCVDITHTMAVELMHACRAANVDCVTAPYEADAQLAYLNLTGIAHLVITEDSDLILFGCKKVVFKLDPNGGGLLVEQDKLHLSIKSRPENYNFEKFRRMCILSGCDYLPSLPGIGLSKASRFITRTMDPDIERALPRMSSYLNMPQLIVTKEYIKNFIHAEAMFKHQPVFDPIQRKVVPLTPLDENTPKLHLPEPIAEDQAYQLALGNLDPFTLKVVANWNPDDRQNTRKNWGNTKQAPHPSIWDSKFQITEPKFRPVKARQTPCSTAGKQTTQNPNIELETSNLIDDKDFENILFDFDEDKEISKQPFKKVCLSAEEESVDKNAMEVEKEDEHRKSPILSRKCNSKSKLFSKLKKQRSTVVDEKVTVQSRYFNSSPSTPKSAQKPKVNCTSGDIEKDRLRDISNVDEVMRRSSPKKLTTSEVDAEKMTTIENSPKRKNSKISFSPGKCSTKSITIRSSLFTELSMEENNDKVTDNCKNKKEDKDNDSGVSCPSSFELDNIEECSQSSAKSAASSSTFAWKQKFHEKFGFKGSGGAERVLSCSKAVSSGFQRPSCSQGEAEIGKTRTPSRSDEGFSGQNEAEIVKSQTPLRADDEDYSITSSCKANAEIRTPLRVETDAANVIKPQTPLSESDDNAQQKTPAAVTRRSNPFKMNSSQKCSMNSTPKFNLLRDAITDCEMDQEMKDQISILSTPAKQKMSLCGQETPNQKNPFGSNKSDKSPSKSIQSNKSLLESIKTEKSPFGSIKQEKSSFGSSKPDKSPFGSSKTGSSIKPSNSSVKGKCRSVGLGKKSTPNSSGNSSQRSLLSMFALQPKPKLECK